MGKIGQAFWLAMALGVLPAAALSAPTPPRHPENERGAHSVPEPTDIALFVAGVVGLLIGRRSSRARRRDDD